MSPASVPSSVLVLPPSRPAPGDAQAPLRTHAAPDHPAAGPALPDDMRCWLQSRCLPSLAEPRTAHGTN